MDYILSFTDLNWSKKIYNLNIDEIFYSTLPMES